MASKSQENARKIPFISLHLLGRIRIFQRVTGKKIKKFSPPETGVSGCTRTAQTALHPPPQGPDRAEVDLLNGIILAQILCSVKKLLGIYRHRLPVKQGLKSWLGTGHQARSSSSETKASIRWERPASVSAARTIPRARWNLTPWGRATATAIASACSAAAARSRWSLIFASKRGIGG